MAGIYIPGMEMPKTYWKDITIHADGSVFVYDEKRDCPIKMEAKAIPVPPHGRLIDADALCETKGVSNVAIGYINRAPTIIPADEDQT